MQQMHRMAAEAGHATLYHYEKFRAEWLTTTLRDRTIHCSDPANLNDPWDCRPCFDDRSFETQKQIDDFANYLHATTGQPIPDVQRSLFDAGIYRGPADVRNILAGLSASNVAYISRLGVYCLTPDPLSVLMWSHYAENHRGICLEFNVRNIAFMSAVEVIYRSEYPFWTPYSATIENAVEMVLTKSADWSYENEFRLFARPDVDDNHPLKLHGQCIRLPENALASVIVGCQGDYEAVSGIVSEHAPGLQVKRAMRTPNRYSLAIEDVAVPASVR
jgi:hypothetical protein